MKIKFIVDVGEYEEGEEVTLADELAQEYLEANSAVEVAVKAKKSKKKEEESKDAEEDPKDVDDKDI